MRRRGGRIVARNHRVGSDEIDLIIAWGRRRVAVEVKTRAVSDPIEEFTTAQAALLRRAAGSLPYPVDRCDVVLVRVDRRGAGIRWIPGVC